MTQSFATKAAFRFGYGFAPDEPDVSDIDALIAQVTVPDIAGAEFRGPSFAERVSISRNYFQLRKKVSGGASDAKPELNVAKKELAKMRRNDTKHMFQRAIFSEQGFRERLVFFWADHFTVVPKGRTGQAIWGTFQEDAIRPYIGAHFADLLMSAVTHPSMLLFLDQVKSVGPNSKFGKRKKLGLNENLAREILELHTMGVGGGYKQSDVRQLAELLTGLVVRPTGPEFEPKRAEPGAETVLGKRYGGNPAQLSDIHAFLKDVARHPDTARNVAQKLVTHFVSDEPDPSLIEHLKQVYLNTDGHLPSIYGAFLDHPGAWVDLGQKAKQPFDFVVSSLRALGVPRKEFKKMSTRQVNRRLVLPLQLMGQPLRAAPGPNGWPEEAEAWITAQGLAARLQWALAVSERLGRNIDPRLFVNSSLRELSGGTLNFAVSGAERREEGLTLVLASPEFNRR